MASGRRTRASRSLTSSLPGASTFPPIRSSRSNARYPESSKATVYNTLKLFLEKKLVRELIVDPARVVYDPNTEPHHHLYDVVTGRLTDIPAGDIRVTGLPPLPSGTVAEGVDIIVRTRPRS